MRGGPSNTKTNCFFISIIFLWDREDPDALVSGNFGSWLGTWKIIWKSGKPAAFPEYSSLSPSIAPTRLLLLSHPAPSANCPSKPNYPLTNRVQSRVIALTITIILSITIYATGLRPLRCDYIPSIAIFEYLVYKVEMSTHMVFKQYRFDLSGKDGRVIPAKCNNIICYENLLLVSTS